MATLVQSKKNGGGVGVLTTTLDTAPTPGNLLEVWLWARGGSVNAIAPTGFTMIDEFDALPFYCWVGYRVVQSGDSASVSTGDPGTLSREMVVAEWSGLGVPGPGDVVKDILEMGTFDADHSIPPPTIGFTTGIFLTNADLFDRWTHITSPSTLIEESPAEAGLGNGPYGSIGYRDGGPLTAHSDNTVFHDVAYIVMSHASTAVIPPGPTWEVRDPSGVTLVTFDHLIEQSIRVELNGPGSGRFVISKHDPQATAANLARGNTVRVTYGEIHSEPIFEFIIEEGDFQLISSDEEGGEELTFGGRGTLAVLERCVNDYIEWDPALTPPPTGNIKPQLGIWKWNNTAAGGIFGRMVREGVMKGTLAYVTRTFSTTNDSDGFAWPVTGSWQIQIGGTVYDEMMKLISSGWFSVEMRPGYLLDAYNDLGADYTGPAFGAGVVRFVKGVNIADQLQRRIYGREWASHVIAVGDGNYHTSHLATYPYVHERSISVPSEEEDDLETAAVAALGFAANQQESLTFRVRLPAPGAAGDDGEGLYYPGPAWSDNGRYWPGDLVTLHTGSDEFEYTNETQRIYAITLTVDETGALAEPIIELNAPGPDDEGNESSVPPSQGGSAVGGGSTSGAHAHSQYQITAAKGQVDGYASLDGDALVPADQLGSGTPSAETVLRGDQTWRLDNLDATTDPAVTDDSGDGYSVGSRWINVSTDEEFVATDVAIGAAVWQSTTQSGSALLDDLTDVDTTGVVDGDVLAFDDADDTWKPVAPGTPTIDWGETADITTLDYDDAAAAGALDEVARADHRHGMPSSTSGGGAFAPSIVNWRVEPFSSTNSKAVTIPAAASGNRLIVAIASYNQDVTGISCTNVTFTEVLSVIQGTAAYLSVYVGVVAGGSSGTTITITTATATNIFPTVIEVTDALTPTIVDSAEKKGTSASTDQGSVIGPIATSPGDLIVVGYATNNAAAVTDLRFNGPSFLLPPDSLHGLRVAIGLAGSDSTVAYWQGGVNGSYAAGVVAVS